MTGEASPGQARVDHEPALHDVFPHEARLPPLEHPVADREAPQPGPPLHAVAQTVLVMDAEALRDVIGRLLQRQRYVVLLVANGE